jgi:hypothetical protein
MASCRGCAIWARSGPRGVVVVLVGTFLLFAQATYHTWKTKLGHGRSVWHEKASRGGYSWTCRVSTPQTTWQSAPIAAACYGANAVKGHAAKRGPAGWSGSCLCVTPVASEGVQRPPSGRSGGMPVQRREACSELDHTARVLTATLYPVIRYHRTSSMLIFHKHPLSQSTVTERSASRRYLLVMLYCLLLPQLSARIL